MRQMRMRKRRTKRMRRMRTKRIGMWPKVTCQSCSKCLDQSKMADFLETGFLVQLQGFFLRLTVACWIQNYTTTQPLFGD